MLAKLAALDKKLTFAVQRSQLPLLLELIIAPGAVIFGHPFGYVTFVLTGLIFGAYIAHLSFTTIFLVVIPSVVLKTLFKRDRPPRLGKHEHKIPLRHFKILNQSTKDHGLLLLPLFVSPSYCPFILFLRKLSF